MIFKLVYFSLRSLQFRYLFSYKSSADYAYTWSGIRAPLWLDQLLCVVEDVSGTHYLRNLFRQLTEERGTSECPLLWRLYLQFVAAFDSPTQVKHVFYKSLQQCPWVKVNDLFVSIIFLFLFNLGFLIYSSVKIKNVTVLYNQ